MSNPLTDTNHIGLNSRLANFNGRVPLNPSSYNNLNQNVKTGDNPFERSSYQKFQKPYKQSNIAYSGKNIASESNISVAQKGQLAKTRINVQIPIAKNKDTGKPFNTYAGSHLFIIDGTETMDKTPKSDGFTLFPLEVLNKQLIESAKKEVDWNNNKDGVRTRSLANTQDPRFVSHMTKFMQRIVYTGVQYTDSTVNSSKIALFKSAGVGLCVVRMGGRKRMLNLWKDPSQGAYVGFGVVMIGGPDQIPFLKVIPVCSHTDSGFNIFSRNSVLRCRNLIANMSSDTRKRGRGDSRYRKSYMAGHEATIDNKIDKKMDLITYHMIKDPEGFRKKFCPQTGTLFEAIVGPLNYHMDNPNSSLYNPEEVTLSHITRTCCFIERKDASPLVVYKKTIQIGLYIPVGVVEDAPFGGVLSSHDISTCISDGNSEMMNWRQYQKDIYVHLSL